MKTLRFVLIFFGALAGFVLLSRGHLEWNPLTRPVVHWFLSAVTPPCEGGPLPGGGYVQPECILPLWVRLVFLGLMLIGLVGGALLTLRITRRYGGASQPAVGS